MAALARRTNEKNRPAHTSLDLSPDSGNQNFQLAAVQLADAAGLMTVAPTPGEEAHPDRVSPLVEKGLLEEKSGKSLTIS